jgi:23S rRNA (pseudouridine1915-N3)-methyltransferase
MKLRVVAVGRDKRDPLCEAALGFLERVSHTFPAEMVEVREEPARGSTPIDRVKREEAARLKKALGAGDWVIALDPRGKELSSEEIAQRLQRYANEGRQTISFLIGGPLGLDAGLIAEAKERWSLSKLTLPHRLARLVLAEQLYRGCTILRGEPYHK